MMWGLKKQPIKADRFVLSQNSYEEFISWLSNKVAEHEYEEVEYPEGKHFQSKVFIKFCFSCDIFILTAKVEEFLPTTIKLVNRQLYKFKKRYFGADGQSNKNYFVPIICVERLTSSFLDCMNKNIEQQPHYYSDYNAIRLPVGISFPSKTVYIAKQRGGAGIIAYKKLRKEFFKIMGDNIRQISTY